MKVKKPSKRLVLTLLSAVLLVAGIVILLYPTVSKKINEAKTDSVVSDFNTYVSQMSFRATFDEAVVPEKADTVPGAEKVDEASGFTEAEAKRLYRDLYFYNKDLQENGQSSYGDPFAFSEESIDLSDYGIYNGLIGTLSVPSISLDLPVYLGASENNMYMGCAVLNRTSMPIGGESTNCVIAGHRGMVNQTMFDNIVKLQSGDKVILTNYWEKLTYKVRETKIIDPKDVHELYIEEGKDLLTLFTCHPYGSNKQRYLVICERV